MKSKVIPVLIIVVAGLVTSLLISNKQSETKWLRYQDKQQKFEISYPVHWGHELIQPNMVELDGKEGKIVITYGDGFGGGSCVGFSGQMETVNIGPHQVNLCHRQFDNSEVWLGACSECTLVDSPDTETSFSLSAQVNDLTPTSRDLVMQILDTFKFTN